MSKVMDRMKEIVSELPQDYFDNMDEYATVGALIDLYLKKYGEDEVVINSSLDASPFILNFSLLRHKASVVVEALSLKDIMVSTISACSSKKSNKSYVLAAMNKNSVEASNPIRLSFDESNTLEEAKIFITTLHNILESTKEQE